MRLAERCCRAAGAGARIIVVGATALETVSLRTRAIPTQTIDAVEAESIIHLAPASADVALLFRSLEYVHDPLATLRTVRSVLVPEGRIIVVGNHLGAAVFGAFGGRHWAAYDVPRQRRVLSLRALRDLASRGGLELDAHETIGNTAAWVESARRWLEDWGAPAWLSGGFAARSFVPGVVAGVIEGVARHLGKGGWLVLSLRRSSGHP